MSLHFYKWSLKMDVCFETFDLVDVFKELWAGSQAGAFRFSVPQFLSHPHFSFLLESCVFQNPPAPAVNLVENQDLVPYHRLSKSELASEQDSQVSPKTLRSTALADTSSN